MDIEYLSYSSMNQYKTCGEQWRLERKERLPSTPGWYHVGGTAFHSMTEALDLEDLGIGEVTKTYSEYFDDAVVEQETDTGVARELWKTAGTKAVPEGETWWRQQGAGMVTAWINWRNKAPMDIWITPDGEPAVELAVTPTFGEVPSKGSVDIVMALRASPGTLVVIDKKTGKPPKSNIQLATYAQAVSDRYGVDCHHGAYYMARGAVLTGLTDLSGIMGNSLNYQYEQTAKAIEHDIFPARPSGLCRNWCDVSKYCAWGGYLEDPSHLPYHEELSA
jgi:putative RecB family exonuclease